MINMTLGRDTRATTSNRVTTTFKDIRYNNIAKMNTYTTYQELTIVYI